MDTPRDETSCDTGDLGSRVKILREQQGMSQRAFIRAIGLSAHSNLADYEAGRRLPPVDIVIACERALGITDGELVALRRASVADGSGHGRAPDDEPADTPHAQTRTTWWQARP